MAKTGYKPTLCLDFDGVIHLYVSGWTRPDEVRDGPVPGAMDFIDKARAFFKIAIFSSRSGQEGGIEGMQKWLLGQLQMRFGPSKAAEIAAEIDWPTEKPAAKVTLDDRAIQFAGVWPSIPRLLEFEPWNAKMKLRARA